MGRGKIFFTLFILVMCIFFAKDFLYAESINSKIEIDFSNEESADCMKTIKNGDVLYLTVYKICFGESSTTVVSDENIICNEVDDSSEERNSVEQSDEQADNNKQKDVVKQEDSDEKQQKQVVHQEFSQGDILITELLPSPEKGEAEWVEIFNTTQKSINLEDWRIQEGSGLYTKLSGSLAAGQYRIFERSSLNNKGDVVTVISPLKKEIDSVVYGNWNGKNGDVPARAQSLARTERGEFKITDIVTPNKSNQIFLEVEQDENMQNNDNVFVDSSENLQSIQGEKNGDEDTVEKSSEENEKGSESDSENLETEDHNATDLEVRNNEEGNNLEKEAAVKKENVDIGVGSDEPLLVSLNQVRGVPLESEIRVKGIVISEPNELSNGSFYLQSAKTFDALQINFSKDEVPDVLMGQLIEVTGVLGLRFGEYRLKLLNSDSYKIIGTEEILEIQKIGMQNIEQEFEGELVELYGYINEKKTNYILVDSGAHEIRVSFPSHLTSEIKNMNVNDTVYIQGIVRKGRSGYYVSPRNIEDINIVSEKEKNIIGNEDSNLDNQNPTIAGFTEDKNIPSANSQNSNIMYIYIACIVAMIVSLIRFYQVKIRELFIKCKQYTQSLLGTE